jgi:hypothetical protein
MPQGPDFTQKTKEILAKRAGQVCSNPDCRHPTSGPHTEDDKAVNLGEAAHIRAAREGQARYVKNMTDEERRHISNGIWLCRGCARKIDVDEKRYPVELLNSWKKDHEDYIASEKPLTRARPQLNYKEGVQPSFPNEVQKAQGWKRSWFIRLCIKNEGQLPAKNCLGRLIEVRRGDGTPIKRFDPLNLYWARQDKPDNFKSVDIQGDNDHFFLDLAQVKEDKQILSLRVVIPKGQILIAEEGYPTDPDLPPGTYFLLVGIYSEGASIKPTWFKVEWENDFTIDQPCNIWVEDPPKIRQVITT